ncbi:MAG: xanthine dehydrogenase family protein molybdopterin-binding subunit [Planctomycetota bacterium]|jgi:xanthine dehydrogenase YagR molybdenum-binding subunit
MSKKELRIGLPGNDKKVEVNLTDETPPPWDLDTDLKVVGKDHPRLDGVAKATGEARFSYDRRFPGMIYARFLRSPHASAVAKVDAAKAKALPGVLHVEEFPGRIRYAGQHVCGVAAETEEILDDALALVVVDYEIEPCVTTVTAAMQEGAPAVAGPAGNVREPRRGPSGDPKGVAAAHQEADVVLAREYRTQVQTHSCLETHGCVCKWDGDKLTVYASTQATFAFRATMARSLGIPQRDVTVITEHMGGGFGSKFGADAWDVFCAQAARATGRPCRYLLDRREEHLVAGNRPSSIQQCKFSVRKDGTLMGAEVDSWGTAGVSGGGAGVRNPAVYRFKATSSNQRTVLTHASSGRAFRAPGHPQGIFALEGMLDELAEAIGMDPLELRRKNDPNPVRQAQYEIGALEIGWQRRRKNGAGKGPVKRGLGMAAALWGHNARPGRRGGPHGALCRIEKDGSVLMANGAQDLGTGTRTVIAIVAAEELGLQPFDIEVRLGHTNDPLGPPSGGSQTAPSLAPVVRYAAWKAKREILRAVAEAVGGDAAQMDLKEGQVLGAPRKLTFKEACSVAGPVETTGEGKIEHYSLPRYTNEVAGVQFAEVEVDTETGRVQVVKIVAVQDCGQVINSLAARSQINGGVIQGISYALFEDRLLDPRSGNMVNADFLNYRILGALDTPEIVSIAYPVAQGQTTTGVSSLGEPPTVPTAGAIANAVANALGVRIRSLPLTPFKVLEALGAVS